MTDLLTPSRRTKRRDTVPATAASAAPPFLLGATRLNALDVFRGITIAAMIVVNKPGDSAAAYAVLKHVPWHGATPTDWIFPFFLFIVGVALPFSIESRRRRGATDRDILVHALKRSLILFALGIFEKNFPFTNWDWETFRIPGVLQRIALCYFGATTLLLKTGVRGQLAVAATALLGYWALLAFVPVPGAGLVPMTREFAGTNWTAWVDQLFMGQHLGYGNRTWDANGLLSSVPSLVTTQSGILAAAMLRSGIEPTRTLLRMTAFGGVAVFAAWLWGGLPPITGLAIIGEPRFEGALFFPINKLLWTSSFVLYTSGLAFITLAACVWLVDLRARSRLTRAALIEPFLYLGTNAIFAYLASGLLIKLLRVFTVGTPEVSIHTWLQQQVFVPLSSDAAFASLLFSLTYALIWVGITGVMYRRRVFIKL